MDEREQIKEIQENNALALQEEKEAKSKKRKKFLSRLATVVAGTIIVSAAATEMMLLVMFGRKNDALTDPFPLKDWADKKGLYWRSMEYPSDDNILRGYMIYGDHPTALVVIAHGMNASSDGYEPVVQYLAEHNYAVMIFDGTASGRSEGAKVVGLQQQRLDVRATLNHLRSLEEFDQLPLVLLGHSAGAYGVAMEAKNYNASAVICLSGFCAPLDTMRHWARKYASVLADVEYPFLWARQKIALGSEANPPADEAIIHAGLPAFVGQGANDQTVTEEISLMYQLLREDPENVTFEIEENQDFDDHDNILFNNGVGNTELLDKINRFILDAI